RDGAGRGEADRARLREDLQRQRQPGPRTMGHPVEVRRIRRAGGPALLGEGERQRRQHRPAEAGGGQRRSRQAGRAEGRRREGKLSRVSRRKKPAPARCGLFVCARRLEPVYFAFGTAPSVVMWILISSLTIGT